MANREQDRLATGDFTDFDPPLRVQIAPSNIHWDILLEAVRMGRRAEHDTHGEGTGVSTQPRTSVFPHHSCFLGVIAIFCNDVQILQCLASQKIKFYNALFKLHFAWQNVLQQCSFLRVIEFFALRTEKIDVQEEVFAIAK